MSSLSLTCNRVLLPYPTFVVAQEKLFGIEAIDFFLAKNLLPSLLKHMDTRHSISESDQAQLFHLIIELSRLLRAGHSCLPIKEIASQCICRRTDAYNNITHQGFCFESAEKIEALLVQITHIELAHLPLVYFEGRLYLRRYYIFEQEVINFLKAKNQEIAIPSEEDIARFRTVISALFRPEKHPNSVENNDIDWQQVAVANALNKSFTVIAGGPGTGKTYTVTKLLAALAMLTDEPLRIKLVAPTGKAAQRLSESISKALKGFQGTIDQHVLDKIPTDAQTLHRLLGVIPHHVNFKHNQKNPLKLDILLIDEVSMVDLPMMARLFRALPKHCKIIMLGDAQQLPSVAAGSVLADLTSIPKAQFTETNAKFLNKVASVGMLPVSNSKTLDYLTYLTFSRRFTGDGGIGQLSKLVIAGESEQSWFLIQNSDNDQNRELNFIEPDNIENLLDLAYDHYRHVCNATNLNEAFALLAQFRVLCALRVGKAGVDYINALLEQRLTSVNANFYHGKPIMITTNDYGLTLYNGDIGLIWRNEENQLMAYFEQADGSYRALLPSRLPAYESVYAMTIHKTQGSEFSHVAMVLPETSENQLLTRELLYTGITRAKNQFSLMSNRSVWNQAVEAQVKRFSGIKDIN